MSRARSALAAACFSLATALGGGIAPAGAAFPGQGFLPDDRAWEMVSPAAKNGGAIVPDSGRTRAAADGSAVGFFSLTPFGDAIGTGVSTDYVARRSTDPDPGNNGWLTHAITPAQDANTLSNILFRIDTYYQGEFSPDLRRGVVFAKTPVTDDPFVTETLNLYRRNDLLDSGTGGYDLITACPFCEEASGPLPALTGTGEDYFAVPYLAGASPDLSRIAFEANQRLTIDTPQPKDPDIRQLFEWEGGEVRLVGRVPSGSAVECVGVACVATTTTLGATGDVLQVLTPHAVSDGSDGHERTFFLVPTNASGEAVGVSITKAGGNLYMRTDGTTTVRLNHSERDAEPHDAYARAQYRDATPDGTKIVFTTPQALTDDAPADGQNKLYIYDTTKPASAPDNLTLLSMDSELGDGGEAVGAIGLGKDGEHVYFIAAGQLVAGEPKLGGEHGIYMWHEGVLKLIAPLLPAGTQLQSAEQVSSSVSFGINLRQARVSPNGEHLLFSTIGGKGVLSRYGGIDHDHGPCTSYLGAGCRELYLYDAVEDSLECVSCNPVGASIGTKGDMSNNNVRTYNGGAQTSTHETRALTPDGRYVFFSTAQKLVPEDTNGTTDAYAYDTTTEEHSLLSSGEDSAPSWFMDASEDGADAFFITRERLSGWDVGNDYDLYDARVGGGFPEPPAPPPTCIGDACQPAPLALNDPTPSSSGVRGAGDPQGRKPLRRCAKGQRRVKARNGRSRCVKRKREKRANGAKRRAGR